MLNSKAARLVIALLAAVLIWGYVVGEVNPSKTKTIRNIPIAYTYEDELNERGLAIGDAEDEYINLEISGARAILGYINPTDISATINVASAQKGDNEMTISIKVPSGITVNKQSITKTNVVVENLTQKPVGIEIVYTGSFESNEQGSTVNMSASHVIVSGAESLVDKIASARGTIDAADVTDRLSAVPCQLVAVDDQGMEIAGVRLSQRSISVSSIIARQRTVALGVPIIDNATDRFIRETVSPETIKIFGDADILEKIDKITAKGVDISQITESKDVELAFDLPDGITIVEENAPTVAVTVYPIEDKKFAFKADEIVIKGGSEELAYALPANFGLTVKVSDKQSVLDRISKGDISISVDVSGLKTTGTVELKVESKKEVLELIPEPKTVTIEVSTKTVEGGETGGTNGGGGN